MGQSVIQRSFHAGELAPALHARADQAKYAAGLRVCANFVVQKEGGAANRAGTRFIEACKTTSATVQILPYVSEVPEESLLLEQGIGYLRFFQQGGPLTIDIDDLDPWDIGTNYLQGDLVSFGGAIFYAKQDHTAHATSDPVYWHPFVGAVYEVPTPFTRLMHWSQSGRIITFTHKLVHPYELECLALTHWVLRPVSTLPTIVAPDNLNVVPGGAGSRSIAYVVTAAGPNYEESEASGKFVAASSAEPTPDAPHVITWDAVANAAEYYVYADPHATDVFGFIGTATLAEFHDVGDTPDFAVTPPVPQVRFNTAGDYPHVSTTHQQRRVFAQSVNEPDGVWLSRTGFPSNFSISSPLQDDDAIAFRLAGGSNHAVQELVSLKVGLVTLTARGEWTIGGPDDPITPANLPANQETYVGMQQDVRPALVGNAILYVQARGHVVNDLRFDQQVEGLAGRDLTIWGSHLFKELQIVDVDYQQDPDSIVWAVRNDGVLLGLTYVREQEIWGWHRHLTTGGAFEKVCVVPEPEEDALYVIVRRTVGGTTVRYIERLARRFEGTHTFAHAWFLDCALQYAGAPVTTVSGLGHLEGLSVLALADGVVRGPFTVTGGAVTLPAAAAVVTVGLPITADLETLDLDVQGSAVRDKKKRVGSVTVLLQESVRGFLVGPDVSTLVRNQAQPWETTTAPYTGADEVNLYSTFGDYGRVCIRMTDPLPLTVLAIIPSLEVGG